MYTIVVASVLGLAAYAAILVWEPRIKRTDYDAWDDLRFGSTLFAGAFCVIVFVTAAFSGPGASIWDDIDTALSIHGHGGRSGYTFLAGACVTFSVAANIHVLILRLRAK